MKKKVKIQVTEADILTGIAGSPRCCPVAHAIARQRWPCAFEVLPSLKAKGGRVLFYPHPGVRCVVPLSERANKFAKDFDDGKPVEPFNFLLEV